MWFRLEKVAMVVPLAVMVSLSNCVIVVVSAVSMCSQKLNVVFVHPAGIVTDCDSVSVWVKPYPSSQAYQVLLCEVSPAPFGLITPAVEDHGAAEPVSKPGLPSNWLPAPEQPPAELTVSVYGVECVTVPVPVTVIG